MRVMGGKSMRLLLALVALFALCGCASNMSKMAPPPSAPAPASPSYEQVEQPPAGLAKFRLTRSFAGPDTALEPIPSSMLLLVKDAPNNRKVCEAFLQVPSTQSVLKHSTVDPNLIVTRMPLSIQAPDTRQLEDCTYLLKIYDYVRAQQWMTRLGLDETTGPFFVVIFPAAPGASTAFIALDAAPLKDADFPGLVGKWQSALAMASTELYKTRVALPQATGTAASPACTAVGEAVKVVSPVLIAMGATALIAEYPAVGLLIGTFTAKDSSGSVVKYFKDTISSLSAYLGKVAKEGCSILLDFIRSQIFAKKPPASAQLDRLPHPLPYGDSFA